VSRRFHRAIRLIYGASEERGLPEPIGSCMLLHLRGTYLLLTAAHVVDHALKTTLHVAGSHDLVPISGEFRATQAPRGDRANDRYDFAAYVLNPEMRERLGEVLYITDADVPKQTHFGDGALYLCLGYPLSKNKDIHATRKTVKTRLWKYTSYALKHSAAVEARGALADSHLFVNFEGQFAKDALGRKVNAIHPRGASGGPTFYIGNLGKAGSYAPGYAPTALLAGMLIEKAKKDGLLVVTRTETILRALERNGLIPAVPELPV
jgi:hypothetical protein